MNRSTGIVLEALRAHGCEPRQVGEEIVSKCPRHPDKRPSLGLRDGCDGRAVIKCLAGCSTLEVIQALNLRMSDLFEDSNGRRRGRNGDRHIVATYDYLDADGQLLYQVVRMDPKDFRQRRPDGNGGWVWRLGDTPRVLYRLTELLQADSAAWVFVVEGEKDADSLATLGLVATCNPGGAGKWNKLSDDSALHGRRVAIIPDRDEPGRKHAADVAMRLRNRAAEIRIVELPGTGKDVTDWIAASGTSAELLALVEATAAADLLEPVSESQSEPAEMIPLGDRDPDTGKLVLSPRRTLPTAETFIREFHSHPDGCTLRSYAGMLVAWRDNRYVPIEDESVRSQLQPWLHDALRYVQNRRTGEPELVPFESNPGTINSAVESIRAYVHLPADTPSPSWLDRGANRPLAAEILPCRSSLLHLPTMHHLPPTPAFLTTNALDYDPNLQVPEPTQWLSFLGELFEDDLQAWDLLQDWFGYCLTGDTSQHKMLLIVGPRRSGKGTIARVLTRLVGAGNVAGPTTSSLAGQFGLQPLIGRSLAIVSDARFSGENIQAVIERLLCISGEDTLTIDRKHMTSVTMKLPTRFMFLTNELPRLSDASGALAGRFMMLKLTESFYGREDTTLTGKLCGELPGILNWAIDGWKRLRERGLFIQPASVEDALCDMEDLSSPVGAFVRECCDIGPGLRAWVDDLYNAWKSWCERDGRVTVTTKQTFGRDLMAAVPGASCRRNQSFGRFYVGIALKVAGLQ